MIRKQKPDILLYENKFHTKVLNLLLFSVNDMEKVFITPEILWRKYIQARPDSVERAGYGILGSITSPEFQYEAKCGEDRCHLSINYSGDYPSMFDVISEIEKKIEEERKKEFENLTKLPQEKFFYKIRKLREEAEERFNKTKGNIPEYKKLIEINKKWCDHIINPLISDEKPLVNSMPCAELEIKPRSFCYDLPDEGYDKWITTLKFTQLLRKLKNPVASFPEIGDSISYSLYEKFSGNFDGVNAERGLTLKYKDGVFNFSSEEKQQESKSVNFKINALGNMVPVKK
jgi:hypothetical protein